MLNPGPPWPPASHPTPSQVALPSLPCLHPARIGLRLLSLLFLPPDPLFYRPVLEVVQLHLRALRLLPSQCCLVPRPGSPPRLSDSRSSCDTLPAQLCRKSSKLCRRSCRRDVAAGRQWIQRSLGLKLPLAAKDRHERLAGAPQPATSSRRASRSLVLEGIITPLSRGIHCGCPRA